MKGLNFTPDLSLSDRIRELCAEATNAGDANFGEILSELQSALHEHAALSLIHI